MGWSDAGTLGVNLVGTYLNDFKLQAAPGGNFTEYGGTDYTGLYGPYRHLALQFDVHLP